MLITFAYRVGISAEFFQAWLVASFGLRRFLRAVVLSAEPV